MKNYFILLNKNKIPNYSFKFYHRHLSIISKKLSLNHAILIEFPLKYFTALPIIISLSLFPTKKPFPFISITVWHNVYTITRHLAHIPFPAIIRLIWVCQNTDTMFLIVNKIAPVFIAKGTFIYPLSAPEPIPPLAKILVPVFVQHCAYSVTVIIFPLALIHLLYAV